MRRPTEGSRHYATELEEDGGTMFDELRRMALFGSGVAELTRYRAEQMVKDLVKAGDLRREQAQSAVRDMLTLARENRKELLGLVRAEIRDQISNLGVANRRDVERLERRVTRLEDETRRLKSDLRDAARAGASRSTPKKTTAKKTTARKTTARKTSQTSRKTPAGRSPDAAKPAETGAGE
ncbi:MAG TPA: phasin family protein [Actinomycetota bacterium]|nr:phasin family protein [Actinomycetota bacterium]